MPLPENTQYRDEGCDLAPACLSCPFPQCRYDAPLPMRHRMNAERDREIVRLFLSGVPPAEIGRRFELSERTVFRISSPTKKGERRAA